MGNIFKSLTITVAAMAGWLAAGPASAAPAFHSPILTTTLATTAVSPSSDTWEHSRYRNGRRHYHGNRANVGYSKCRRGSGTTGMIVGGAAGALLGREVDGGRNRTTGTIVGAAGGALVGREIQRNRRCR